ncbi:MAG: CotH kinase family protein [Flavobacteriales bacterium]|jgi:hypothetical protein|nr:CotH kinase family protein [Flavobacteriales bacterium]
MRKTQLIIFLLLFGSVAFAQPINHWETLVYDSVQWRYVPPTSPVSNTWSDVAFNDATWNVGMGGIGFGDGDDSTVVSGFSVFMRHQFVISNLSNLVELQLAVDYDDGYVAYLNGVEIARRNMGNVGTIVAYDTFATGDHEALLYSGGIPEAIDVNPNLLVSGANVLAVQVHNRFAGSSDLTSRPFLFVGTASTQTVYGDIPTWFTPPVSLTSQLPIVVLNTLGQAIVDDPRIVVQMGIIDNGFGNLNNQNNPFNNYDGLINIELRGSSSQSFPKKQYAFETQDSLDNSLDVSLLGMPIENDWILHAPYSDKSLMRNYLTYNWWRDMGWYTTRTKFCEVILNGEYQGVYLLMEQIKWDNDRVDIEKLDLDDNAGDSLSGGYIFKVDKITGSGQYDWASHVDTFQGQPKNINFQYDYPNRDEITVEQESYVQQFVHDWEQSLIDSTYMQADIGYRKYVDVNSFIDYFLVEELTKNVDGYRLSTYLNKQRDSRGGKLRAGPAWDFNITLGNADYCDGGETENWALDFPCGQQVIPFWWHRMNQDSVYWNQLQCRWWELRAGLLSSDSINAQIDANVAFLGDAATRNFERWDILNSYVWPNNFVGGSYEAEITYLKDWISQRLQWLDLNIGGQQYGCASTFSQIITLSEINYNSHDTLNTQDWFELQNISSDTVDLSFWTLYDGNEFNTYTFPMGTYILPDSFLVVMKDELDFVDYHPDIENRVGSFGWGIGNSGDQIMIRDRWNDLVLEMAFLDEAPWPTEPDGDSYTLEKWSWATDLNNPASWHAGCAGGSPGKAFTYCINLGMDENELGNEFRIYPNPANDYINIYCAEAGLMSIFDSSGRMISKENLLSGVHNQQVSLLTSGLYMVNITTVSGKRFVKKLVIN